MCRQQARKNRAVRRQRQRNGSLGVVEARAFIGELREVRRVRDEAIGAERVEGDDEDAELLRRCALAMTGEKQKAKSKKQKGAPHRFLLSAFCFLLFRAGCFHASSEGSSRACCAAWRTR